MPPPVTRRDGVLPILIVASLVVHATIMLPSLLGDREMVPAPPREIPVEVIQLPPEPAPKPQVARKAQPKPNPQKQVPKPEPASTSERMRALLGAMPAIALPGASGSGTEDVSYSQLVLSKVAKAKKDGRYQGMPGAASVTFTLGDAGEVASVSIARPSGDPSLDDEAIAMVKRGAPYPPPPPGGRRDYTITLRFQPLI